MPTPETLERVKKAEERMTQVQQDLIAFIERPSRNYSQEEKTENKRLLDRIEKAIAEYWAAFERASHS